MEVSHFLGSLNWASGLIPLGCLHLRPLQRHFHSLGLTNLFTPPCRSDTSVLANLLGQWQDLSFLTPYLTFPGGVHDFYRCPHMGDSQISGIWTSPDHKLHINTLELKVVILALHHWVSVLRDHQVMIATDNATVVAYINKQGRTHSHTLLGLVVDLATNSRHSHPGQKARHILGHLNVIADRL